MKYSESMQSAYALFSEYLILCFVEKIRSITDMCLPAYQIGFPDLAVQSWRA